MDKDACEPFQSCLVDSIMSGLSFPVYQRLGLKDDVSHMSLLVQARGDVIGRI